MTETTKSTIISFLTSIIMIASSIPAFATFLTPDTVAKLQTEIPAAIGAISTLIMAGTILYKMWPSSRSSILKGATEQSGVQGIVADRNVAEGPKLKDNPKVVSSADQLPPAVKV